jgi:hypothetical protein
MRQTKEKANMFLEETLLFENEVCRAGLNKVLERVWDIVNEKQSSEMTVLKALALAKDCYVSRMHLLETNDGLHRAMEQVLQYKEEQQRIIQEEKNRYMLEQSDPTEYALSQRKF